MRVFKTSQLMLALFASLALAACSSTPTDQGTTTRQNTAPQQPQNVQTQPVEQQQPTQVVEQQNTMPVTADNFWNNPVNYDGTTDTRVIYFAFDQSTIPSAAFATLRAHADYLSSHPNAKIRLEGNTDERGTREYNIALGERRAKSVSQYLRVQGVSSSQIQVVSYGEEKKAAYGHDAMSWAKNRRVEINYLSDAPN